MEKFNQLLALAQTLSSSQGFYGRLLRDLLEMDDETRQQVNDEMTKAGLTDDLSIILWLES